VAINLLHISPDHFGVVKICFSYDCGGYIYIIWEKGMLKILLEWRDFVETHFFNHPDDARLTIDLSAW